MKTVVQPAELAADALKAAHSALVIADARADDLPIVYANPAFERLTGYRASEVVGRNCRFLQGPETDLAEVRRMRQAIAEGRPVNVLLANYRKDGSLFYNDLHVDPVRNESGEVTHFVGCQNEVANPDVVKLRIEAIERIGSLSRREREVFEGLVRGESVKELARECGLSPRTVEKHRYRMQKKMGTTSLALLVRYAIAAGNVL